MTSSVSRNDHGGVTCDRTYAELAKQFTNVHGRPLPRPPAVTQSNTQLVRPGPRCIGSEFGAHRR
jgi:hypothetical protein